ncbi:MAG: GAF and ANTAR domain-containing protein [Nakamurella sp.]
MAISDEQERAPEFAALAELAEAFNALVEALHEGAPVALSPARIVDVAAACMPRSQHTSLTAIDHDEVRIVAATSDVPRLVDRIRDDADEGPVLDVLDTNDLVMCGDLMDDPRWPVFGAQVTEATNIRSVVSYRLYLGPDQRAALTFYSNWPHAFDDLGIATGAIFAAYASLALTGELVLSEPVRPRRSADVHREIGVAIGIMMATTDLTTQAAYHQLHQASLQLHRSLPNLAKQVIAHRRMPDGIGP